MSNRGEDILKEALSLPPAERARIAERLLSSLDPPSRRKLDKLWADEAEERLEAFDRGEIKSIPAEEVFSRVGDRNG